MSILKRIKESFNRFLERSAKANKESYGSGVPDCCKMNNQVSRSK